MLYDQPGVCTIHTHTHTHTHTHNTDGCTEDAVKNTSTSTLTAMPPCDETNLPTEEVRLEEGFLGHDCWL